MGVKVCKRMSERVSERVREGVYYAPSTPLRMS